MLLAAPVLIVLPYLAAHHGKRQTPQSSVSSTIIAAEHAWAKAAVDGDVAAFAKYMSDDYVLIVVDTGPDKKPHFEFTSKSKWVDRLRAGGDKYDAVELDHLDVRVSGNVATVTGHYSQTATRDGKNNSSDGIYVNTWVQRQGQWQVITSVFP
jgi:ketosteroid isomerase-like protein